jgi:diaminopimelate decarboxylase
MAATDRFFWLREGLEIRDGRLTIAGRDAEQLARTHGTPVYVYDLDRVAEKLRDLQAALDDAGLEGLVRFAVKANHHPEVLEVIRDLGAGIDVSSPGEVELALAEGFAPEAISFTGTNLTDRDMQAVIDRGVHMNVDLLSQLRRYGRLAPGTGVGIRVNPRAGGAYSGSGETLYSGDRPTKFGIYEEQLDEALGIAEEHDLAIDTVHMHVGDGFLDDGLEGFEEAVERAAEIAANLLDAGCPLREVNTGGGLGLPQAPGERPLDLDAYAAILERHLERLGVTVSCEPGDYLVKDSAVLLCEVVTVEDRLGVTFVGVDAGWNVMPDRFVYGVSPDIVLARAVDAPVVAAVTVSGHINEGDDLFAEEHPMPDVREGDIVAMMDVGGYHQSMSSTHCLRPHAPAVFLLRG